VLNADTYCLLEEEMSKEIVIKIVKKIFKFYLSTEGNYNDKHFYSAKELSAFIQLIYYTRFSLLSSFIHIKHTLIQKPHSYTMH
jgi:hypothetical protein